ncbi:MAG TPA: hypothetical protein VMB75_11060, partial [Rhodocyclaceae bacterium]|nr:hypothetical protein [Rhodocyclaceae bacterium]
MKQHHDRVVRILPALIAAAFALPAVADGPAKSGTAASGTGNVFTLGEISVTAKQDAETPLSTTTLDREDLWDFSKDSLPDALNMVP